MTVNIPGRKLNRATEDIKHKAFDLGFDLAGISQASKLDGGFLKNWFDRFYHAEMEWMVRSIEKRIDPDLYFPGVKSIISAAVSYYSDDPERPAGSAQISRYAAGKDYHIVLEEKLGILLNYIQELLPGVNGKIAVDSAPVLDKIWAANAGIGWIGKHSNVISRKLGSYIFLGEILLDCELSYDKPGMNHCGKCTKCLNACPTGAIVEPYVVDSNKCISYLTIERRGEFNSGFNAKHDWIFGCDICQEVCPWNKFARETTIPEFLPRPGNRFPLISDVQNLSKDEFREKFRQSPIKRAKFEGLKRNTEYVRKVAFSLF